MNLCIPSRQFIDTVRFLTRSRAAKWLIIICVMHFFSFIELFYIKRDKYSEKFVPLDEPRQTSDIRRSHAADQEILKIKLVFKLWNNK